MLKENYEEVQKKITEACKRAGRNREEVTLIAVSKTKPVEMLSEIYDLGERNPDPDRGKRCRRGKQVWCLRRGNPSID